MYDILSFVIIALQDVCNNLMHNSEIASNMNSVDQTSAEVTAGHGYIDNAKRTWRVAQFDGHRIWNDIVAFNDFFCFLMVDMRLRMSNVLYVLLANDCMNNGGQDRNAIEGSPCDDRRGTPSSWGGVRTTNWFNA